METKESQSSKLAQETFSATVEVMGEYIIKIALVEFPWLNLPVVRQVFSFVLKRIISRVSAEGQLAISFSFTDREIAAKKEKYEEAVDTLKEAINSNATQEKKNEAIEETKKRLRDLIRFPVK